MSNTRAPIQNIPLNGTLNLSYNKAEVKPFTGFNKRNAPFLSETLSPIYAKEIEGGTGVYDTDGNFYSIEPVGDHLSLTKNGVSLYSFSKGSVSKGTCSLHTGNPQCMLTTGDNLVVLEKGLTNLYANFYSYTGAFTKSITLPDFSNPVLAYDTLAIDTRIMFGYLYYEAGLKIVVDVIDTTDDSTTRHYLNPMWDTSGYNQPILTLLALPNPTDYLVGILDKSGSGYGKESRIYAWKYNTDVLTRLTIYTGSYLTQTPPTYLAKDGYLYQVDDSAGVFAQGYPHTPDFGVPVKASWGYISSYFYQGILPISVNEELTFSSGTDTPAHGWNQHPNPRPTYEITKDYYRAVMGNKVSRTRTSMNKNPTNLSSLEINDYYYVASKYFVCTNSGLYYANPGNSTWLRVVEINVPVRYMIATYCGVYAVGETQAWRIQDTNGSKNCVASPVSFPSELIQRSNMYAPLEARNIGGYYPSDPIKIILYVPGKEGKAYWSDSETGTWNELAGGSDKIVSVATSNMSFDMSNFSTDLLFLAFSDSNVMRYTWNGAGFDSPVDCGIQLDVLTNCGQWGHGMQVLGANSTGVYFMDTAGDTTFDLVVSDTSGAVGYGYGDVGFTLGANSILSAEPSPFIFTKNGTYQAFNRATPTLKGSGNISRLRQGPLSGVKARYDEQFSVKVEYEGDYSFWMDISALIATYEDATYAHITRNSSTGDWIRCSDNGLWGAPSPSSTWNILDEGIWVGAISTAYVYSFAATDSAVYTTTYESSSETTEGYSVCMFEGTRNLKRNNVGTTLLADGGTAYAGTCFSGMQIPRGSFKVLYNNTTLSGVSLAAPDSSIGALLSSWNSLDTDEAFSPVVVNSGTKSTCFVKLNEIQDALEYYVYDSEGTPSLQVVFNKYIVLSRAGMNCYDAKAQQIRKIASDYNNTLYLGVPITAPLSNTNTYAQGVVATSQAPLYDTEAYPFPSCILNPRPLYFLTVSRSYSIADQFTLSPEDYDISVYYTANQTSVAPAYVYSIYAPGTYYTDSNLVGQYYPIQVDGNILQPIPLFFRMIADYTSQAVVVLQNNGYPVLYNSKKRPIFLYAQAGQVQDVQDGFVISGALYFLDANYIYRVTFSNLTTSDFENVAVKSGMLFIGNTTRAAYFYSSLDRSLYEFTGALNLNPVYECSEVEDVIAFGYNVATGEVGISTGQRVVIFSGKDIWAIEEPDVDALSVTGSGLVLHTADKTFGIRYYKTDGYQKLPLHLQTQFYGLGNNQVSKVDTLYLRLTSIDPTKLDGTVKVSATVLTDITAKTSVEAKEFKIKASDWDLNTNTYYIRYQPRYQTALAVSFDIESDFAVEALSVGSTPMGVSQLTKNSI